MMIDRVSQMLLASFVFLLLLLLLLPYGGLSEFSSQNVIPVFPVLFIPERIIDRGKSPPCILRQTKYRKWKKGVDVCE